MKLKKIFQNNNQGVLFSVIALVIVGSINIFSASSPAALDEHGTGSLYFIRQIVSALLGGAFMIMASSIDYHIFQKKRSMMLIAGVTIVLLLITLLFGITANGATRWIRLGIVFQTSEIAKIAAVFLAAGYLGSRLKAGKPINFINRWIFMIVVMGGLVYKQPDLGTATIVIGIGLLPFLVAGLKAKQLWGLLLGAVASIVIFAGAAEYRMTRIQTWLDPWQYAKDEGYQAVQAQMTIGAGGLTGMGWGKGMSKFFYLPEAHTDFAFAMFCQELGLIGAFFGVILPFALFTLYGMRIATHTEDYYGKLLAMGLTALVSGQAVANMMMVLGLLPVIGVPLPFISYGGTSLVINLVCVGILLNIGKQSQKQHKREMMPEEEERPQVKLKLVPSEKNGRIR